jgi:hypothetical protein
MFALYTLCTFSLHWQAIRVAPLFFCTFVSVYKVFGHVLFLLCFLFLPCQFLCGLIYQVCVLNDCSHHITDLVDCHPYIGSWGIVNARACGSWSMYFCPLSPTLCTCFGGAEAWLVYLSCFAPLDFVIHLSNSILPLL